MPKVSRMLNDEMYLQGVAQRLACSTRRGHDLLRKLCQQIGASNLPDGGA
jgi:hypothetical protein